MNRSWEKVASFEDPPSAEALAEHLRKGGVPARVQIDSPMPGVIEGVSVYAAADLGHRARWIMNSDQVSDSELEFAATGCLQDEGPESE